MKQSLTGCKEEEVWLFLLVATNYTPTTPTLFPYFLTSNVGIAGLRFATPAMTILLTTHYSLLIGSRSSNRVAAPAVWSLEENKGNLNCILLAKNIRYYEFFNVTLPIF